MRRAAALGSAVVAVVAVSLMGSAQWTSADATATAPPPSTTGPQVPAEQTESVATEPPQTTGPPVATPQPESVSFCHGTGSVADPYHLETTTVDSIVGQGHVSHAGPVFPAVGSDGTWGDIIPPFGDDNGQQRFPGLNWPAGSAVLEGGCAVHQTNNTTLAPTCDDCVATPTVTEPNIVVNVSCRSPMNLDVTFNEEPPSPWTLSVFIDGVQEFSLVDADGDLRGFHPVIEADRLPQTSYRYSVDASNDGETFPSIASADVVCQTTTTAAPPTTTQPSTSTSSPTTTAAPPTTSRPSTSTSSPTTGTSTTTSVAAVTTTVPRSTSSTTTTTPGQTSTTTGLAAGGSTTTVAGVTTTTNPGATDSGGTTTTATPLLTETPLSTAGLTLQDLPPVRALALGEALPDPPPRVLAFVITRGNNVVVLGELSADQVRTLYRELAERRLAHTGNDTGVLPLVAALVLLSGGALLGLSRRRGAT